MTLQELPHDPLEQLPTLEDPRFDYAALDTTISATMNTRAIDTGYEPINVTPMTFEEARECTEEIKSNLESCRLKFMEMERRRGWDALGYSSWREWASAEIGRSQRRVYEILEAAKVEENLTFCGIPQNEIPTTISQLRQLAKLPPQQQSQALHKAEEIAQAEGKKRNAAHVAQAVQEIKPSKKKAKALADSANSVSAADKRKISCDISAQSPTSSGDRLNASPLNSMNMDTNDICKTLNSYLQYFTDSEVAAVFGAIAYLGAEEITDLCNKCLASIDGQTFLWLTVDFLKLSGLSDLALKLLLRKSKRTLNSRHQSKYLKEKMATKLDAPRLATSAAGG